MNRFRNPRFAPESLERKLSPSSLLPAEVAAYPGLSVSYGSESQNMKMMAQESSESFDRPMAPPPPPPINPIRLG